MRPLAEQVILTSESSLRGAEGDLLLYLDETLQPVAPWFWRPLSSDVVEFATQDQACRYDWRIAAQNIGTASQPVAGAIAACTVTNISRREVQPLLWCAWRHTPPEPEFHQTQGILLSAAPSAKILPTEAPDPWNEKWTWYFQDSALIRQDKKVYWIRRSEEWSLDHWIRRPLYPYTRLERTTPLGFTSFTTKLRPNQTASFEIVMPYLPLPLTP